MTDRSQMDPDPSNGGLDAGPAVSRGAASPTVDRVVIGDEIPPETWPAVDGPDPEEDDGDYVTVPREASTLRKVVYVLAAGLFLLAVLAAGVGWWVLRQVNPPGEPGDEVAFVIPDGATSSEVARLLEEDGIITNASVFRVYLRVKGAGDFQAGEYDGLQERSSMGDVVSRLEEGPLPPPFVEVTVPEGLRLTEIVARWGEDLPDFDPDELLAAFSAVRSEYQPDDVDSLEGFLFPETYRVEEGDEADEVKLLTQMVEMFDEVAGDLGYGESNRFGLTPYELVIVASIIEREAQVPEDRARVARVVHNRLEAGMKLEIDATLLYAIGHTETLTESDLATDTLYNTRLYPGLPPTPIAMPGREALEAALEPADGDWLYYVLADESGEHFFTSDFDEFLRVKAESQAKGLF